MYKNLPIQDIYAREILDSRGNPTIEVEVLVREKSSGESVRAFRSVYREI